MSKVVRMHLVVVQEHTAIEVLGKEVKSHVVDMCRHNLIDGVLLVAPINGKRKGKVASLQEGHFTLEVLILACVVVLVSVSDTNSGCQGNSLIVLELSSSKCLL